AVAAAAVAAATAAAVLAAPALATPDNPLEEARRAAQTTPYTGQVRLEWRDAHGLHQELVGVRSASGVLMVDGPGEVIARQYERFIRRPGGDWSPLWPAQFGPQPAPSPSGKYDIVTVTAPETAGAVGAVVAGRPAIVVDVRRQGVVVERLSLDAATG